jgi:YidC/Oxa1 family membrane protein insertase
MESMKKMKQYTKEIEKLKKKHKGDKQKLMKAQADFYKEKGINPGAGCLPYLLQIVILISLFRVFSSVLTANGEVVAKLNELLYSPLAFSEGASLKTGFLYLDITSPDVFNIVGLPFALPGVFVVLAALVQFLSAKMVSPYVEEEKKLAKATEAKEDDMASAMQSSMIYTFPLMTLLIGMRFPSGLALYWLTFSVFQMVTQYRSAGWGGLTPWVRRIGLR